MIYIEIYHWDPIEKFARTASIDSIRSIGLQPTCHLKIGIITRHRKRLLHIRRSPSSATWSPMRCATLSVILPPAAALQPAAASTTLVAAATAAAALSKLLETNWASCSILTVIVATLARDVAPRHRRHSPPPSRERAVAGETRRREAHPDVGVPTPRVLQDAIRPPANPHADGRDGNAPRCFPTLPPSLSSRPRHDPGLAAPRPLSGGRHDLPPNRRSLAFAPAFPPAAETLAAKLPLSAGRG